MATRQETFYWPYYPGNVSCTAGSSWYTVNSIDMSGIPSEAENITCAVCELRYSWQRGGMDTSAGYAWINDTDGSRYAYNINATNINKFISERASWFAEHKSISFHVGFKSVSSSSTVGSLYFSLVMQYDIGSETYVSYSPDGVHWYTYQTKIHNGNIWGDCQVFKCINGNTWTECNNG